MAEELAEAALEIGQHFAIDGDELRGGFARIGGGVDRGMIDFAVEIAAHLTASQSVTVGLLRIVGKSSAGEEEVGINRSDVERGARLIELIEGGLDGDG